MLTLKRNVINIIALLFIILNISVFPLADAADTNSVIYLNLQDAQKYIESQNSELKLMDKKIEIYKKDYEEALDKADDYKYREGNNQAQRIEYRKIELLNWKQKLRELNNLKYNRDEKLKSLKRNVSTQYLNLVLQEQDIENLKAEIANIDKKIQEMNIRFKAGQLKESDLKPLYMQKSTLQSQYNAALRQYDIAMKQLKKDLNIDIKKTIKLSRESKSLVLFGTDNIGERISYAAQNSHEVLDLKEELELAKLEYQIVKDNTADDEESNELRSLETGILDKELAFEDAIPELEASLWTKYYNLKNLEDNIEIEKLNLQIAELTYSNTQSRAKIGKASALEESNDRLAAAKAKVNLQRAINEYMLVVEDFKAALGE